LIELVEKVTQIEDISESLQEYIETIYRLSLKHPDNPHVLNNAISQYMNKKPSSVTNMLRKLSEKKLIRWKPRSKNIQLTVLGRKLAQKIIYNHYIMELFLKNVLGIHDEEIVHKYACELEHHMNDEIFQAFKKVIGKKSSKKIEAFIAQGKDPELIFQENITFLPSPDTILKDYISRLVKIIPDKQKIFNDEKERYLSEY
jgi:Mn-dependent DtxR family transcriptional regulator